MKHTMSATSNVKRKKMVNVSLTVLVLVALLVMVTGTAQMPAKKRAPQPLVQLAILLDTSGSMEGLIEQAKTQLWKIVNEMATAKKEGASPKLEVALYEYGKSSIPASEGYIRMIVPLSGDLDLISEELFKLKTNGGSEYCGHVIQSAARELKWSKDHNNLKVIFIAGNEPFTQGQVNYKDSCKEAISNSIIVNTIFCGNYQEGINTQWKDGADCADGKYINIDHNKKIVQIDAPQDKEIVDLGKQLNETYIAYGSAGKMKKERQAAQDMNAASAGSGSMVQRQMAKASKQYSNASWDVVDAEKEGMVKVEELSEDQLPEVMKKMTKEQRKQYVEDKKKERKELQEKIAALQKARDKYVAEKRKGMAGDESLDRAIIEAVKEQAGKKKYKFEKE